MLNNIIENITKNNKDGDSSHFNMHHENELETINKMVGENKIKIINTIDEPNNYKKRNINEEKSNKQIEGLKNVMPELYKKEKAVLKKNKITTVNTSS